VAGTQAEHPNSDAGSTQRSEPHTTNTFTFFTSTLTGSTFTSTFLGSS
jgi:hypothetical protein